MRLVRSEPDKGLSLTEFCSRKVLPCVFLSHTGGSDDEEVTFRDMTDGTGKSKAGYCKFPFCRKQAARDNLQ